MYSKRESKNKQASKLVAVCLQLLEFLSFNVSFLVFARQRRGGIIETPYQQKSFKFPCHSIIVRQDESDVLQAIADAINYDQIAIA